MLTEYCKNPSNEGRDKADSLVRVGEEDSCGLLNVLLNQGQLPQVHQGGCKGKGREEREGGEQGEGTREEGEKRLLLLLNRPGVARAAL